MKNGYSNFVYKHITKLPWLVTIPYTLIAAWIIVQNYGDSFLDTVIRLYVFGIVWWFLFQYFDEYVAVKYRKKVLLNNPGIRAEYIKKKMQEIEELGNERDN